MFLDWPLHVNSTENWDLASTSANWEITKWRFIAEKIIQLKAMFDYWRVMRSSCEQKMVIPWDYKHNIAFWYFGCVWNWGIAPKCSFNRGNMTINYWILRYPISRKKTGGIGGILPVRWWVMIKFCTRCVKKGVLILKHDKHQQSWG